MSIEKIFDLAGNTATNLAATGQAVPPGAPDNQEIITPLADGLSSLVSFRERQVEVQPRRLWFIDGMVTPGFNMLTAKKSQGKSFLLMQMANAIAEGKPFLGRETTKTKVLLVSFELDECDTHERFAGMEALSDNAFLVHAWAEGDKALAEAERAITEYGFKVIIFDTFLPMLPQDGLFKVNEYGDSGFYLQWRRLGKRNGAAIVASWHEGKSPRDDFMLNAIGSTGMVAQADCIISIDRKRGDAAGKLFIGGNHAPDAAIPIHFENGIFALGEGPANLDRLTPSEEKTLDILAKYPEGCTPAKVALELGKSDHAAVVSLNRLIARGKVARIKRGVYVTESHKTSQMTFCDQVTKSHHGTTPYRGCAVSDEEEKSIKALPPAPEDLF